MFELEEAERLVAKIKVIGIGGCGCNALNNMAAANIYGVEFIAVNTDKQHLEASLASMKIQIGASLTKGLGAGANPVIGRQAANEDKDLLVSCIEGADLVFITAGMGGGTGTGAAPVVASLARELGILTVGVVTKPFYYEGRKRLMNAEEGLKELKKHVDTLIVIPNDRIHQVVEKGVPLLKSFSIANDVLRHAIQGISDVILIPGLINLDFADVRTVMENSGKAVIGIGSGKGDKGAFEAAKKAITNPLIDESSIEGAKGILINITGGLNLSHNAVEEAASLIYDTAHNTANIILGAVIDPDMEDEIRITVIATGLEERIEKTEITQIKKWDPKNENINVRGSERILSKSLSVPNEGKDREATAHNCNTDLYVHNILGETISQKDNLNIEQQKVIMDPLDNEYSMINSEKNEIKKENQNINNPQLPIEDEYDAPTFLRKKQ